MQLFRCYRTKKTTLTYDTVHRSNLRGKKRKNVYFLVVLVSPKKNLSNRMSDIFNILKNIKTNLSKEIEILHVNGSMFYECK